MLTNTKFQQNGIALLMSIILLLVITIVAVGGLRSTTMQERMSANFQEGIRLFQGSENKLNDTFVATLLASETKTTQGAVAATTSSGVTSSGVYSQSSISLAVGYSEFIFRNYKNNVTTWIDHDGDGVLDADESSSTHSQGVTVLVPLVN